MHNIDNKLNAWLTFFSSDEPKDIMALISAYPEFRELYEEIASQAKKITKQDDALAAKDAEIARLKAALEKQKSHPVD